MVLVECRSAGLRSWKCGHYDGLLCNVVDNANRVHCRNRTRLKLQRDGCHRGSTTDRHANAAVVVTQIEQACCDEVKVVHRVYALVHGSDLSQHTETEEILSARR